MCTSASKKKPSSRRPCVCKKGCMRVKRVAGDAGDCGGLSAERDPGEANFLTRKSLKTGKKSSSYSASMGPPQSPANFLFERAALAKSPPQSPATPANWYPNTVSQLQMLRGSPAQPQSTFFLDVHPQRLANRVRASSPYPPSGTGPDVHPARGKETETKTSRTSPETT
jgi:hypothetical protein